MKNRKYEYTIHGLDCANCAMKIQNALEKEEGFENVVMNYATSRLSFDAVENIDERLEKIIHSVEPEVKIHEVVLADDCESCNPNKKTKKQIDFNLVSLVGGTIIGLLVIFIKMPELISTILMIIAYALLLQRVARVAIKKIFISKVLDENTLITISAIGAYLVGEPNEGMMVVILYEIGKLLEARAVNNTRRSIQDLMNIKPLFANIKVNNIVRKVKPEEVELNDIIVIKNGEKIPLDGVVVKGTAKLDNSSLTGETKHIGVSEGDEVLSGSINVDGLIEIVATKLYKDSTVSKILQLVENATDRKAKTETTVSKVAKIYTPIVLILAILTATILPIIVNEITYSESIYRALIFLVISCPCAIAISVPLSYFSGIGRASKGGILIKGSDYLDALKDVRRIVFDKTGTLTNGKFSVSKVCSISDKYKEDEIIKITAIGEKYSNHPIAKSIIHKCVEDVSMIPVTDYKEIPGKGISYVYENKKVLVGNLELVEDCENKKILIEDTIATSVYIAVENSVVGYILIKDEVKKDTKSTIKELKEKGITCSMFTGDKKEVALSVANEIGIDNVEYEMLPTEKYEKMKNMIEERKEHEKIAFAGDGINDSPVLALADVGIAMGGVGSESSIEASDIVIMKDEPKKIVEAIMISKKTNLIITQNLVFAIGTKITFLVLSLFGCTGMWQAIFADVGVTLITILNSIRILKMK